MLYTPYYNAYPQPNYAQPVPDQLTALRQNQQAVNQPANPIIWVQGEAAARAYMVAAGNSVLLMDSDASVFYLKSTDASGMPQPMRIFDYKERTGAQPETHTAAAEEYVTRKEFDAVVERLNVLAATHKEMEADGEHIV